MVWVGFCVDSSKLVRNLFDDHSLMIVFGLVFGGVDLRGSCVVLGPVL